MCCGYCYLPTNEAQYVIGFGGGGILYELFLLNHTNWQVPGHLEKICAHSRMPLISFPPVNSSKPTIHLYCFTKSTVNYSICLSHYSSAVKRHCNQDYAYKRKHITVLLTVSEGCNVVIMAAVQFWNRC